jgi:tRNA 2-selenouridine synthase
MASYKHIEISDAFQSFDDILDVRSPAEYLDDHLPGAINVPVLNDEERARIGTLYTQVSPFDAKRLGAALIAKNIAQHLQDNFSNKPKAWRPLVYCWRGGMRSGAMAHILAQIGWQTSQLKGGYKIYRRHVLDVIEVLPAKLNFCVINGGTGSGKSRLLHVLAQQGAQVLDLEALAQHRGSLLGRLPGQPQPSQKTFETLLWQTLRTFTPERPIYVEAESRKVGVLSLPTGLVQKMRLSSCVMLEAPLEVRITFLINDYQHFLDNPTLLTERLKLLVEMHGHEVINRWCEMAHNAAWEPLVGELLEQHYDPAYKRSSGLAFKQQDKIKVIKLEALNSETLIDVAKELIHSESINNV